MKIRILGNTIRIRVKMFETDALKDTGMIEEVLSFGPDDTDKLRFQVMAGDEDFAIVRDPMIIRIVVPQALVHTWATTDLVGFEELITTSKGAQINVLVEKDFACLDGDREEEEGSYPNPIENCN